MIALFTDFGLEGPYLGQVRAVLAQRVPAVPVIDLFADAPAFLPQESAYLLAAYSQFFPVGTVFLCVVDPGVGGKRPAVAAEIDGRWFVGPGNGLFEPLARRARTLRSYGLDRPAGPVSNSFHGRDVFAPAAAALAAGDLRGLRPEPLPRFPDWPDDLPRIVYIDRFGNAMTGLRAGVLAPAAMLAVNGRTVARARTFSDVPPGTAFWYENANGLAEIAVNCGNAAKVLGLAVGEAATVL